MSDTEDIKQHLDEHFPDVQEGDYIIEVWMSTDGKHTVHGKATQEGQELMFKEVAKRYQVIEKWKGTKQNLNKSTYQTAAPAASEQGSSDSPTVPFGKNKGKKYSELEDDYLRWLVANTDDPAKGHAEDELKRRINN